MQFYKPRISFTNSIPLPTLIISVLILLNIIGTLWIISSYSTKIPTSIISPNKAFITFANSELYSNGIVALAESLKEVKSEYPFIAMVTPQVSQDKRNLLSDIGCIVRLVHELDLPEDLSLDAKRWGPAFTKLISWQFEEYSKLIFLDSDMLALQNIDELFHLNDTLHATLDADASSCTFKPERLQLINSGVLVLKPHKKTFDDFIRTLYNKELLAKGAMNDQDVINYVVPWKGIPYPTYGAQVTHCECDDDIRMWDDAKIKLVHFTAGLKKLPKPWDYMLEGDINDMSPCLRELYEKWNQLYTKGLKRATRKT